MEIIFTEFIFAYSLAKCHKKVATIPYDPADFLSARLQCSQFLRNCINIKPLYGRGGRECWRVIAQTIGPKCSMTHCPGKIEYNCCYFLMTFRKWIRKNKFSKNDFHTLQGTMSHRPLSNTSSLKITAAYCTCTLNMHTYFLCWLFIIGGLCFAMKLH